MSPWQVRVNANPDLAPLTFIFNDAAARASVADRWLRAVERD